MVIFLKIEFYVSLSNQSCIEYLKEVKKVHIQQKELNQQLRKEFILESLDNKVLYNKYKKEKEKAQ